MKAKIATVVGVCLVVLGSIIGVAAGLPVDIVGAATVFLGAGAAAYGLWQNRNPNKPKGLTITAMVLVCGGALIAGFTGFSESALTSIMGAVISIVMAIAGILTAKHLTKEEKLKKNIEKHNI